MRVFFDTNVLISALIGEASFSARAFDFVLENEYYEFLTSQTVITELENKLAKKFNHIKDDPDTRKFMSELRKHEVVGEPLDSSHIDIRDRKDAPILAAAISVKADILITGDKDFSGVDKPETLRIMSPREFCDQFISW